MTIAYIRVSTNKQDLNAQKLQIFEYCKSQNIVIDEIISLEISSTKSQEKRKIQELKSKLKAGDMLLVTEISRLGRNMLEIINIVLEFTKNGVKLCFLRQMELNNFNNPTFKLILSIYAYLAEIERDFISQRTKAGLHNAKAKGKILGRPKNSFNSFYDKDIKQIKKLLKLGHNVKEIWTILNYDKTKSYVGFYCFCKNRKLI
ncbi:recombinase family protein [Campylobacter hyointestinalis]|uniref:Recombinase family protein n=1 Tax=Campylobacter hyointestinalis subsp. lawsonii TaxID=91353 RepID=A0AAV6ED27_CAMHY|nr:recombinase family protein [Campylobacter hyointestinalis]KAB0612164.1 recombinase family protein [Campylobacter hyointestinalis subsp. lawsonii]QKF69427.1 resolvase [Campylobacter hyointestinalis subsp. lawsonii]RAZ23116.1 resolvase [Campylobacter hyointestinalis subsp. lawsonii]RAZ27583.1 resolvase [Campylobacter hyointestinalis subsp. lawsonii]RAZ37060.1 resolvase [Campylobacter hyointestinalis subsp. lawsonii]